MKNLFFLLMILTLFSVFSCERQGFFDLAKYGMPPEKIYIYSSVGTFNGNLNGRNGADQICEDELNANYSFLSVRTQMALISVSSSDEAKDLVPEIFHDIPIYGVMGNTTETLISDSWTGLFDGAIDTTIDVATDAAGIYWTGSDTDGTLLGDHCSNWTMGSSVSGHYGDYQNVNQWLSTLAAAIDCGTSQKLLCVAY